jgi:hypothetical protein
LLGEILSDYISEIRSVNGMEIPLASDHHGHISTKSAAA